MISFCYVNNNLYLQRVKMTWRTPFFYVLERCDDINNVENGNIALINDGRSTIAVFTCGIGSSLNGSSVSVCDLNGSWNTLAPVCGKYS